jgi:hypothetical protein
MTNQRHPITPPPDLVRQWMERTEYDEHTWFYESYIAEQAAQWGWDQREPEIQAAADQELLACGNYLKQCAAWEEEDVTEFYNYRRPRPPSLKELALESVKRFEKSGEFFSDQMRELEFIRKALEQLDD